MALQTSGAISLNDIHIEAGGASGTTASINDADIRALIGKGDGVTMSFSEWYGASGGWTTTVTVGQNSSKYVTAAGYSSGDITPAIGSVSDNTVDTYGGATLYSMQQVNNLLYLQIQGSLANSGWTNFTVDGVDYPRASANYIDNTTDTLWFWSVSGNVFGTTTGVDIDCTIS